MNTVEHHKVPQRQLPQELLAEIRKYLAVDAIGVTTLRGQAPCTREAVHEFLNRLDLSNIPRDEAPFRDWLDCRTEDLRQRLPRRPGEKCRLWGVARKSLNLFLRGCVYNRYLCEEHHLEEIEQLLEVPLDSSVAKGLIDAAEKAGDRPLPQWKTLKGLDGDESSCFQGYASTLAKSRGLPARVFLDHAFFLGNGEQT